MNLDQDDVNSLALCVWKEARGEGCEGMRAVAHVIINRVGVFAKTLHDVIYGKNQFTSMSVPSDPEFNLKPLDNDPYFIYVTHLAENIYDDSDLTNGARYYANLKYVTSGWFVNHIINDPVNHPQTAIIGHHTFFK